MRPAGRKKPRFFGGGAHRIRCAPAAAKSVFLRFCHSLTNQVMMVLGSHDHSLQDRNMNTSATSPISQEVQQVLVSAVAHQIERMSKEELQALVAKVHLDL